jgi:uncharacterized protein (DUF433 family)
MSSPARAVESDGGGDEANWNLEVCGRCLLVAVVVADHRNDRPDIETGALDPRAAAGRAVREPDQRMLVGHACHGRTNSGHYVYYNVVVAAKTQPFSIRLGEQANRLVEDEVRRSGRSRSVVVEELAEEAAKARLHPGIAFRGRPRRAWVIGSGLDVWEVVELLDSYGDDLQALTADHPLVTERHLRAARAYAAQFAGEIETLLEENRRPPSELAGLYPFLQHLGR